MPCAVHEILFQSVFLKDIPRGGVHFPTSYPCLDGSDRGFLRFLNRPVPLPHALAGTPHMHCTRHVAAIVAEYNTQVQHHQLIFPNLLNHPTPLRHHPPATSRNVPFIRSPTA